MAAESSLKKEGKRARGGRERGRWWCWCVAPLTGRIHFSELQLQLFDRCTLHAVSRGLGDRGAAADVGHAAPSPLSRQALLAQSRPPKPLTRPQLAQRGASLTSQRAGALRTSEGRSRRSFDPLRRPTKTRVFKPSAVEKGTIFSYETLRAAMKARWRCAEDDPFATRALSLPHTRIKARARPRAHTHTNTLHTRFKIDATHSFGPLPF